MDHKLLKSLSSTRTISNLIQFTVDKFTCKKFFDGRAASAPASGAEGLEFKCSNPESNKSDINIPKSGCFGTPIFSIYKSS